MRLVSLTRQKSSDFVQVKNESLDVCRRLVADHISLLQSIHEFSDAVIAAQQQVKHLSNQFPVLDFRFLSPLDNSGYNLFAQHIFRRRLLLLVNYLFLSDTAIKL